MNSLVHFKKTERFLLLYALYKKSNANTDFTFNLRDLALEEGLGYKTFKSVFDYLCSEGLLRIRMQSDNREYFYHATITERGINAVEEVFQDETQPTDYFPAYREMMM
jgi:predicted transcriptional regulator